MDPILSLKKVYKKIGKKNIINDLTFDVYPGEIFGFIGPNGAGKTTTIRMIVGLTKATSGKISINNYSITSDYKKAIEHVGTIVENPELYQELTAEKNLLHFGRMSNNVTKEDIQNRLELVRLSHVSKEKVRKFSLGMKQRLGIAQAVLHNPKVLILDEPTNGLDPAGVREMRDYLRKLAKEENIAILVSSHLLSEIELMCDRYAIIKDGNLLQVESVTNEAEAASTTHVYTIEVNNGNAAKQLLSDGYPDLDVQFNEERLHMQVTKEQAGEIITFLTGSGITIYQAIMEKQTLEDRFLQATNGGVSDVN